MSMSPIFDSMEEDYFYNQGKILEGYEGETNEWGDFYFDQAWKDPEDFQRVDQVAQNNLQSYENEENRSPPPEIINVHRNNFPPPYQNPPPPPINVHRNNFPPPYQNPPPPPINVHRNNFPPPYQNPPPPPINVHRNNFPPPYQNPPPPPINVHRNNFPPPYQNPPLPPIIEITQRRAHSTTKELNKKLKNQEITPPIKPKKKQLEFVEKKEDNACYPALAFAEKNEKHLSDQNKDVPCQREPVLNQTRKRKLNVPTFVETKQRRIKKQKNRNFDSELDAKNEGSTNTHLLKPKNKRIYDRRLLISQRLEIRREIYSRQTLPTLISEPSKVDIKLGKYIQSYYGKITPRKGTETYKPLHSKKILISKLNILDDETKQVALTFFKNNHNSFASHLTKMFDILCHKALIDPDKQSLALFMNKYLQLNADSPTIKKDRVDIMDRLMKVIKNILGELNKFDAELTNENEILIEGKL